MNEEEEKKNIEDNKNQNEENDEEDEKDNVSWYIKKQNKTINIIKKYNIGTLQMFINPEILSMTNKERKKIEKIYYKREYTSTPSESQKFQKEYEKELALQKEQKEQKENIVNPPALPAAAPAAPIAPALPKNQQVPQDVRAPPPPLPPAIDAKKQVMVGGGFDSDFNDDRYRLYGRDRDRFNPYTATETRPNIQPTTFSSITASSLLSRATNDAEPFIASLIKFNNSGFPNNATIKARVDTFFNINLFKAFVKKLGEPIKLYGNDSQIVSVDDIEILNQPINQKKDDSKKKVFETDLETEGSFITNWYPAQEQKKLIGSVYAFIYSTPSEKEIKQISEMGKKIPEPSMLMIKEGDNYRLIGGPVDNREKMFTPYGLPTVSSSKFKSYTDESTVANQINSEYRKITGQSTLPAAVSNTGLRFIYEPKSSNSKSVNAESGISQLKSVIYTRQVTSSQMDSIIESSRVSSTDIVKVPIIMLFNILSGKTQTIQVRIDLDPNTATILKFLFRILEKQNLLSSISAKQKKKTGEIYEEKDRISKLREKLSESSLNELDGVIRHNIRFILDILFSTKTTFMYKGVEYIIDYLEWNNTFKQLRKVLENYKVGYYIELELFLEKLEKGKLAIDRDGTLFSSCAVRGSQIKTFWRRNFLEQNWSKVGRQLKNSIKIKSTPSITDILPGFVKKALNVGGSEIMSQINAGVNQISFVQYCFLGQDQLIQDFNSIDNSFAGVSWKNENSWSKRKEILFNAMDMCGSDIYCFQNVQCSLDSYRKIIESLTDSEKYILADITTPNKQSERIKIHRKVLNQLLEKVDDPLNLLAQIYERYKQEYFFVYFFEQSFIGGVLTIPDKKTALGNLTMFKIDKFELKDEADIRMGAFINKNRKSIENINSIEPIYSNTSFATVTYCTFKGGVYKKPASLPGQMPGSVMSLSPIKTSMSTTTTTTTTTSQPADATRPKLPGLPGYSGMIKISEDDDNIPDEGSEKDDAEGINDYEEEGGEKVEPQKVKFAPTNNAVKVGGDGGDGGDSGDGADGQVGGDGADGGEWYAQDNSEQAGLFSGLFGKTSVGKQSKVKPEAELCKKYMSQSYIPGGQIFGIINIKLETAETLKKIEAKKASTTMSVKFVKQNEANASDKKITKQMLEVLLVSAFVSKFRVRYYYSSSTDVNPYFMSGDFNFDIPYDQQVVKSEISKVYSVAPALALLLTRSNNVFKSENYPLLSDYAEEISYFIKACKIVTYLYGGKGKNGRLRLNGYTNSQTLPNLFGHKYSLTNPDKINKSGLIFTTGKLLLCPKEEMKKIVNSDSTEGLPIYPNKSNPSNSEAIGGVFELDTAFVNEVIKQVAKSEVEEQQNQQAALDNEAKRSIINSLVDITMGASTGASMGASTGASTGRPGSISPVQETSNLGNEGKKPPPQSQLPPQSQPQSQPPPQPQPQPQPQPDEIPDWTQSTSGNLSTTSVELIPPAIQIAGDDLKKLNNYEYTVSKAKTVKGSPYKKSVVICETGKPDYNYLTSLEMSEWDKPENKDKIYSDHSPIMYNINNTNNSQCGPQLATATATTGSSAMSGGEGQGGYDNATEMEGGAFPAEIKLITWNIASHGGEGKDKDNTLIYFHKFNGKSKEGIEHYKSRLANNARAIRAMMKGGYDYTLIQEGPTSVLEIALNSEEAKASSTASSGNEGALFQPFKYKELLTTSIKNKEGGDGGDGGDGSVNLDIVPSEITDDTNYFGEFYLVVNKKTVNVEEIKSLGFLIKNKSGEKIFSNNDAETVFNAIISMVKNQNIQKYDETFITKDCLRLWFFVNTKNKQILTSTHLSLDEENTPKMYVRQRQIYILLNTVVSYFRQDSVYAYYDIIFSGDFNINLLQPFPTDVQPTFLKCTSVAGQQTFIYTSKNNAPSSFGGENEGKYNPTNIDFTVFYPKVGPSASLPEVSHVLPIHGIIKRATVEEFKQAHANGVKTGNKIPGGVDDTITYKVDGSNFETALKEINAGQKKTDWMWYIFPSDLPTQTRCSTFFRIGPDANKDEIGKNTITIPVYLKDKVLMKNYMTITEALYDKVEDMLVPGGEDENKKFKEILKKIMVSDNDYSKLRKSIQNFYNPLKEILSQPTEPSQFMQGIKFLEKMNRLNFMLNGINDESLYLSMDDSKIKSLINCDSTSGSGSGSGKQITEKNLKKIQNFLNNIYNKKLYYILNDLCYFKDYKIGKQHCFIQDLLSNGYGNTNLLENMRLLTTQEFNREYLAETDDEKSKIATLISSKDTYLSSIDDAKYTDYNGKTIDKKMVDDILGFLYDSERYSLYLYLIDDKQPQPVEGKKIIVSLYSTVISQNNDKVESVFSNLTTNLVTSISPENTENSKLMESLKKVATATAAGEATAPAGEAATAPAGPKQLLQAVKYVKQSSNGDGNCFYNSIGMLSSKYMVTQEEYNKYLTMNLDQQCDIQFQEQSRVRQELTEFLTKIYELVNGKVDMDSSEYKNSTILKYIIRNGKGDKKFKYVRKISKMVGEKYYGSDEEIPFASLFYLQPIITVTGISGVTVFNIFDWETYSIEDKDGNRVLFKEYIEKSKDEIGEDGIQGVIDFLITKDIQHSYDIDDTSKFLLDKPGSYFLVGGRGHWSYAVNVGLLEKGAAGLSTNGGSGGNASYNLRNTKKIKNKYYKKESLPSSSSSSSSKTTKKHKKTRRANKNKDNKGNNDNKLQIKNVLKKTIKR